MRSPSLAPRGVSPRAPARRSRTSSPRGAPPSRSRTNPGRARGRRRSARATAPQPPNSAPPELARGARPPSSSRAGDPLNPPPRAEPPALSPGGASRAPDPPLQPCPSRALSRPFRDLFAPARFVLAPRGGEPGSSSRAAFRAENVGTGARARAKCFRP